MRWEGPRRCARWPWRAARAMARQGPSPSSPPPAPPATSGPRRGRGPGGAGAEPADGADEAGELHRLAVAGRDHDRSVPAATHPALALRAGDLPENSLPASRDGRHAGPFRTVQAKDVAGALGERSRDAGAVSLAVHRAARNGEGEPLGRAALETVLDAERVVGDDERAGGVPPAVGALDHRDDDVARDG